MQCTRTVHMYRDDQSHRPRRRANPCALALHDASPALLRYALQHGYCLTPVYTFGENRTYSAFSGLLRLRLWINSFQAPTQTHTSSKYTYACPCPCPCACACELTLPLSRWLARPLKAGGTGVGVLDDVFKGEGAAADGAGHAVRTPGRRSTPAFDVCRGSHGCPLVGCSGWSSVYISLLSEAYSVFSENMPRYFIINENTYRVHIIYLYIRKHLEYKRI